MYIINGNRKIPYIHYKHNNGNIVVLCHAFLGNKNSSFNNTLQERFTINGIDSFSFDFYGHGEADGDISSITIEHCINDLTAVIKYLTQEYDHISLVANSMGGLIALSSTEIHDKLSSIVLRSPVSNWYEKELNRIGINGINEWIESGYTQIKYDNNITIRLSSGLLKSIKKHNAYKVAGEINCPVLIIHGKEDKNVPIEQSYKLKELLPHAEFLAIENGSHNRKSADKDKIIDKVVSFTCFHLKSNGL